MNKKTGQKSTYCEHCGDFHDPREEYLSSVRVGEAIPDFEFEAYQGSVKLMKLSDYRGKWLVLMFYPADWSTVCPTELADMAASYKKFTDAGAEVIAMSTDTALSHAAWLGAEPMLKEVRFPLGADPSGKVSYAFGVLAEGDGVEFIEGEGMALRGTFIIDPSGVLRSMEVIEHAIGRNAAETLRKLKAAQYVDKKTGNVCPAGWEG